MIKIKSIPGDFVGLEFCPEDRISDGGIHLPDQEIVGIRTAIVKYVGNKCSEPDIKKGSKVLVTIYDTRGQKFKTGASVNGEEIRIYPTDAVLAILE